MNFHKLAEEIYDEGPSFEAGNQTNRDAWVEKIERGLESVVRDRDAEIKLLTKYNETLIGNVMEVQDKACLGHIEEVARLKAEVDVLLNAHAGDKGMVKTLTAEVITLSFSIARLKDEIAQLRRDNVGSQRR